MLTLGLYFFVVTNLINFFFCHTKSLLSLFLRHIKKPAEFVICMTVLTLTFLYNPQCDWLVIDKYSYATICITDTLT